MNVRAGQGRRDREAPDPSLAPEDLIRVVAFLEALDAESAAILPLARPDPVQRMSLYLLRRHLESKPVTVTSLAQASGVPYATAMRRIDAMIAGGLVRRRPKATGRKTFLLFPDPALIEAWSRYAERLCRNAARCLRPAGPRGSGAAVVPAPGRVARVPSGRGPAAGNRRT